MNVDLMNDSDVADFLLTHPAFFERHAELLGRIRLANPHGQRAVSLPERQIEMLREKNRQLERRLSELVRYGHENDGHAAKLDQWAARLLAESSVAALPEAVCSGLRELFNVPRVSVRLWRLDRAYIHLPAARSVGQDIEQYADALGVPYCGANTGFAAAAWLTEDTVTPLSAPGSLSTLRPMEDGASATMITALNETGIAGQRVNPPSSASMPAQGEATAGLANTPDSSNPVASIALVPLQTPGAATHAGAFGLLALGSDDPQRFQNDMGTDFLIRLSLLTSAALSRLLA